MLTLEKTDGGGCQIFLDGNLDIYNASALHAELMPRLKEFESFAFDLSAVGEMDTSCFQVLVQAKRECDKSNKNMTLVSPNPALLDILSLYCMESFFDAPTIMDN